MIAHRQRGFRNFYAILVGVTAVALLFIYAKLLPWIPRIGLLPSVNLVPYGLAIVIGSILGRSLLDKQTQKLHALQINQAMGLAISQAGYIAACVFALMFATKDIEISRLFLGTYLVFLTCLLTLLHVHLPRYFARLLFSDSNRLPTLLVGRKAAPQALEHWVIEKEHLGIDPVGYLAEFPPDVEAQTWTPYLGPVSLLETILQKRGIAQVILLDWFDDPVEMDRIVSICESEGCRFLIQNNFTTRFARNLISIEESGHHFLAFQEEPLEDPLNRVLKRSLDIAIALPIVMTILPPLTLMVWLVQRWQAPGSILFVCPRGGHLRKDFPMLKFRSMYSENHGIGDQATLDDKRIYPFGRFLRKSSLDEFPQFINVLRGEMSIVGPRPHLLQHDDAFSLITRAYRIRSLVKPGITGLAQTRGFRGEITDPDKLHRRVYWDLYYVTNWGFWMDIRIMLRTAWQVFFPPKTAY